MQPFQEFVVVSVLALVMGGPFALIIGLICSLAIGSLKGVIAIFALAGILALHPLPKVSEFLRKSKLVYWMYRYFRCVKN